MPRLVDHDAQKERILAALWRVVARDGAAALSIRTVAAEAGMAKSSIAYYFPTHNSLVAAAIQQTMDATQTRIDRMDLTQLDLDTAVAAFSLAVPDSPARRRQAALWLHLAAQPQDPELRAILHDLNLRVDAGIAAAVSGMAASGLLAPGRDLALETRRLHALIDGLSLQVVSDPRGASTARVRDLLRRHLMDLAHD